MTALFLFAVAAAPSRAADPAAELSNQLTKTRLTISSYAEGNAERFLEFVLRANDSLDSRGVTAPEHRAAVVVPAANKLAGSLIAEFDAFAQNLRGQWRSGAAPLAPVIERFLDRDRERFVEFVRADPTILLAVGRARAKASEKGPFGEAMADAAVAAEEADAGAGFAARLRRAAVVGDAEVERVTKRRVRIESEKVSDRIADSWVAFFLKSGGALDEARIASPAVRGSILGAEAKKVSAELLADYDRYATAMKESFAGGGPTVSRAADEAVDGDRARLLKFLSGDLKRLNAAVDEAKEEGAEPVGSEIMRSMEWEVR